jgi:hypothetical protein
MFELKKIEKLLRLDVAMLMLKLKGSQENSAPAVNGQLAKS